MSTSIEAERNELRYLARTDADKAERHGVDLNPFSTAGARRLWQAGWNGETVANMVEQSGEWRYWERGRQARILADARGSEA